MIFFKMLQYHFIENILKALLESVGSMSLGYKSSIENVNNIKLQQFKTEC